MSYGYQNNILINFFDKSLYEYISEQSNLYSVQVPGKRTQNRWKGNSIIYWHNYIDGGFEIPAIQKVLVTVYRVFFFQWNNDHEII